MQNRISGHWVWARFFKVCLFKYCYSRCNTDHAILLSHRSSKVENGFLGLVYINKCHRRWINPFFLEAEGPSRTPNDRNFILLPRKPSWNMLWLVVLMSVWKAFHHELNVKLWCILCHTSTWSTVQCLPTTSVFCTIILPKGTCSEQVIVTVPCIRANINSKLQTNLAGASAAFGSGRFENSFVTWRTCNSWA